MKDLNTLKTKYGATVVQEVEKSFSNQKVTSSFPHCRSVLEQDTEPLIAKCAVCHQCKCKMYIHCKSHICKSLWIKASAKCKSLCYVNTHYIAHCTFTFALLPCFLHFTSNILFYIHFFI